MIFFDTRYPKFTDDGRPLEGALMKIAIDGTSGHYGPIPARGPSVPDYYWVSDAEGDRPEIGMIADSIKALEN